jgi:hypothetical protein
LPTTGVLKRRTLAFGALSKDDIKHLNKANSGAQRVPELQGDIPESVWTKADCVLVIHR